VAASDSSPSCAPLSSSTRRIGCAETGPPGALSGRVAGAPVGVAAGVAAGAGSDGSPPGITGQITRFSWLMQS